MKLKDLIISKGGSYPPLTLSFIVEEAVGSYPIYTGSSTRISAREEYSGYETECMLERLHQGKGKEDKVNIIKIDLDKILDEAWKEWKNPKNVNGGNICNIEKEIYSD